MSAKYKIGKQMVKAGVRLIGHEFMVYVNGQLYTVEPYEPKHEKKVKTYGIKSIIDPYDRPGGLPEDDLITLSEGFTDQLP